MRVPSRIIVGVALLWVVLFGIMTSTERTPSLAPAAPIDRAADRQLADELERVERQAKELQPVTMTPPRYLRILEDRPGPGKTLTGSAFAVSADRAVGYWITNHHVTEHCQWNLKLLVRSRSPAGSVVRVDERNDLALMGTSLLPEGRLPVASQLPYVGEEAYVYGFPAGQPGVVSGRLLGRAKIVYSRRDGEVLQWIETARRATNMVGGLNGASGGPMVNAVGEVVGVMVSGEPRRGRFNTVPLDALRPMIPANGGPAPIKMSLQERGWEARGVELMRRGLVAKVACNT